MIAENYLYRFRNISKLLSEYNELENQSIFFTGKEALNDPTEGLCETVWNGDKVVWQKLFENYLLSFLCLFIFLKQNQDIQLITDDIIIEFKHDLQDEIEKLHKLLIEVLNNNRFIKKIVYCEELHNLSIDKNTLLYILKMIHPYIQSITYSLGEKNHNSTEEFENNILNSIIKLAKKENLKEYSAMFQLMNNSLNYAENEKEFSDNHKFLIFKYPYLYLDKLESLIYPDWGTVCFSKHCNNVAMWGYYADSHKGVALKFKTKKIGDNLSINLYFSNGGNSNGKVYDWSLISFNEVHYGYEDNSLYTNFFEDVSALQPKPDSLKWWYAHGNDFSKYVNKLSDSNNYKSYWDKFYKSITTKHENWKHEEEYRLIKHRMSRNLEIQDRITYYKFEDLEGIIFGIKTSAEDKHKITDIISKKCEPLFSQIKLYLSGSHKLSIETIEEIFNLITSSHEIVMYLAIKHYAIVDVKSLYIETDKLNNELLYTLVNYPEFEILCNKASTKRTDFKFYQAYYDNITKQIETLELFLIN